MSLRNARKFLALGDSYTIGESVPDNERWPVQLTRALNARGKEFDDPVIIATTGWRTDDLKKAIEERNPPHDFDLVSLLIGVNNQYQGKTPDEYLPEFKELVQMAIDFAGGDPGKIIILSIPDYGFTPFGEDKQRTISPAIDAFNSVNRSLAEAFNVCYVDVTPVSRTGLTDPELLAADGLHPSGKMYKEWVNEILKRYDLNRLR
jgi:lysophospholipase L1-like esterase